MADIRQEDTFEESVLCPCCGSTNKAIRFECQDYLLNKLDQNFPVVECLECWCLYPNPRPRVEFLSQYYPDCYSPFDLAKYNSSSTALSTKNDNLGLLNSVFNAYLNYYLSYQLPVSNNFCTSILRPTLIHYIFSVLLPELELSIPKFQSNAKLLEIGPGSGKFLKRMQLLGWDVYGIEWSKYASELITERFRIPVKNADWETTTCEPNSYDVICLWHVIEHFSWPVSALQKIHLALRPGGQLLLSTSNAEASFYRKLFGKFWHGLDQPRHRCIFGLSGLVSLLEKEGFEVLQTCYQTLSVNDFIHSARAYLAIFPQSKICQYLRSLLSINSYIQRGLLLPLVLLLNFAAQGARINIKAIKKYT